MSAARPENGNLVTGSMLTGWALTERGMEFATSHREFHRGRELMMTGLSAEEQRFLAWQRKRLRAHAVFNKVTQGPDYEVTARDINSFFLLDPKTAGAERREKIERYVKVFGPDPEIEPVVKIVADRANSARV